MRPRLCRAAPTLVAVVALAGAAAGCNTDDAGDLEAFCEAVDLETVRPAFALDPVEVDVDAALAQFRAAAVSERRLRSLAPPEARDDLDVLIEFVDDLVAGLEAHQVSPPTTGDSGRVPAPVVFDELQPRFADVEAAGTRLSDYVTTHCTTTTTAAPG